ncbi:hypothetical protein TNCV_4444311 [Trichonephila clavipes]|nr:hypothetical protein TNCV_4444311 [Trichonephila clavipes]
MRLVTLTAVPLGLGSNPGEDMDVCKCTVPSRHGGTLNSRRAASPLIVRVQYFVRGGFVGHRSRASSKHLSPHLPVDELDSSGVKKGLRCSCKMHVWVSGPQRSRLDVDVSEK